MQDQMEKPRSDRRDGPDRAGAAAAYGEAMADVYDRMFPRTLDVELASEFIATSTPSAPRVLEMGVGTGRLALPIAARGCEVHGVDASPRMLEKLAERDPGGTVTAHLGDFRDVRVPLTFDVALIGCNTLFMVPDQDDQVATLQTMRDHVGDEGRVVVEAYTPLQFHALDGPSTTSWYLDDESMVVDTTYPDRVRQFVFVIHHRIGPGIFERTTEFSRYAWPAEIDLMARLAGLTLDQRYENWQRSPFTGTSSRHVSVYRPL